MERCYDIFEVLLNDVLLWRGAVEGREAAILKLHQLADHSPNEFRLMYLPPNAVISTINASLSRK